MDAALRKLGERALEDNLVLKSLARNGFLEYRPLYPGTSEMKLVRTAGQAWRDRLPNPADSHRMQRSWLTRRYSYVNDEGKPEVPMKFDEEFAPEARSVAPPEEVVVETSEAGYVTVRGPEVKVAGIGYEEVQCFLGGVDLQKAVNEELERLTHSQKSVRARLLEFDTSDALRHTLQRKADLKIKLSTNRKATLFGEGLKAKLKARNETNDKLRKQLLETGWSVQKLVGSLEPRVGVKKQSTAENQAKGLLKMKLKLAAAKAKAKAKSAATSGGAPAPAAKSGAKSAKHSTCSQSWRDLVSCRPMPTTCSPTLPALCRSI